MPLVIQCGLFQPLPMALDSTFCDVHDVIVLTYPFVPLFFSLPLHYLIFSLLPLFWLLHCIRRAMEPGYGQHNEYTAFLVDIFFNCLWDHTDHITWKAE